MTEQDQDVQNVNQEDQDVSVEFDSDTPLTTEPPKTVQQKVVSPKKAAADTKKFRSQKKKSKNKITTTPSGYRVKLVPVAANVLREAQSRIPDATTRTFTNPTDGKEYENPAHPEYIAEVKLVQEERTKASMNVMVLFGMELLDDIPEDNEWLERCRFAKLITEEEYKEAISVDGKYMREMLFKTYVVSDFTIINQIASMSGVTQEMIAEARDSFPS